jgi:IS5 family transposase
MQLPNCYFFATQVAEMTLKREKRQLQMFELNFADLLDPNHELMRAAKLIDWDELHEALRFYYSTLGRQGKPIRLMVGFLQAFLIF